MCVRDKKEFPQSAVTDDSCKGVTDGQMGHFYFFCCCFVSLGIGILLFCIHFISMHLMCFYVKGRAWQSGWWPKKENSCTDVFGYLFHLSHCNVERDKPATDQVMVVLGAVEGISLCFKWEWVPHLWSVHSRSCRCALSHHPFIFVDIYLARKHNLYASQRRPTFSIFILSLASDMLSEILLPLLLRKWIWPEGICWKIDETSLCTQKLSTLWYFLMSFIIGLRWKHSTLAACPQECALSKWPFPFCSLDSRIPWTNSNICLNVLLSFESNTACIHANIISTGPIYY